MVAVTTLSELTIDGKLTLGAGLSSKELFAFYGDELREWFHAQRAAHDAIMVGAGTVRADDPELTVRYAEGPNPIRIVPSNDGDLPSDATILNDGGATWLAVPDDLPDAVAGPLAERAGVEILRCGRGRVNLATLATLLAERGVGSLIAEGGSRLLHALHAADLVSRIVIKHIPVISGSHDAAPYLVRPEGAAPLALSRWRVAEWFVLGGVGVSIYEPLEDCT